MQLLACSLAIVVLLDVASNAILFWSEFHTSDPIPYSNPQMCLSNFFSCFMNWRQYSLETLALLLFRLLFNFMAVVFAVRLGAVNSTTTQPMATTNNNGIQTPLLNVTIDDPETKHRETPLSQDGEVLVRGVLGPDGRKNRSKMLQTKFGSRRMCSMSFRTETVLQL